jgi:hypothetical protein
MDFHTKMGADSGPKMYIALEYELVDESQKTSNV